MSAYDKSVFLAGAASADITPPVGTCLYGYSPGWQSGSVHDPLNVAALAVNQHGESALLITAAVGDLQTELCDEIRKETAAQTGVDEENIIISATHTHSAPNVSGAEGWGEIDRPYVDSVFMPAIIKAARKAVENLRPAEIAVSQVRSEVGVNRRQLMPDGRIEFGQNPWGCRDPVMTVVSFREPDGKPIGNLIHYNNCFFNSAV